MLALLSTIDLGVLLLYLATMLAVGVYFSSRQHGTAEFFLGSRSLDWFPLGLSLAAIIVSAAYPDLVAQAYEQGLKCWIMPASFWLILPIVVLVVIPIYRGLGLTSLYEYLEFRFDARVRLAASLIFVVWRLLWLASVIYMPCNALMIAAGWQLSAWALIVPLGIITTLCTFLGGMRAVVWMNIVQVSILLFGAFVIVVAVWLSLDGGPSRVAEIARSLGRAQPADLELRWTDEWTFWGALPHWLLLNLMLCVADQMMAQRLLCARSINAARTAYLISVLAVTFLLSGLIYIGVCLLAFYHDHPQYLRPEWVVNLDAKTRGAIRDPSGQPLLDDRNPQHRVTWENMDQLVAERRLLRPNDKLPFTSAEELIDPVTNRVLVEKLMMRRPNAGTRRGEVIIRRGAAAEMLPQFIAAHLPWGAAGIALAALLAGAMLSISAGLISICTLLVTELHRHVGWGRAWLASRLGKQPEQLTQQDELTWAQPLTLVIGLAATVSAIGIVRIADLFGVVVGAAETCGATLLAVFLLGMLTRRTTAAAALVATVGGCLLTLGLTIANKLAAAGLFLPKGYAIAEVWNVIFGFSFTYTAGYLLSFILGHRKTHRELRGLVAGCGTLGVRTADEEVPLIGVPDESDLTRGRQGEGEQGR